MSTFMTKQECIRIYGKHKLCSEYGPLYNSIYAKQIEHNIVIFECGRCDYKEENRVG